MLVKKYNSEVISIINPFQGIYSVEFRSLNGIFKYHPGQFLHLAIDSEYDGTGQWPESRCFSIQSNPDEDTLRITYAVKGQYTKCLETELRIGSKVWIKLPYGDLFSRFHNKSETVFIAGGTGITPFLSLFTHESFAEYVNPRIYLGFKSLPYNVYGNELGKLNSRNTEIFYEDTDGLIDIDHILAENGINKYFFISGPPAMISYFKKSLISKGVMADRIVIDEWE
jgi:ferredoxin-NADP reductase